MLILIGVAILLAVLSIPFYLHSIDGRLIALIKAQKEANR